MNPATGTSSRPVAPPDASVEPGGFKAYVRDVGALSLIELTKLRRDPTELLTRAIQPALWLLVFGQVFGRLRVVPTGNTDYQTFLVPGILAQSVLFIAIFYGISVIWERDLGILQKLLVSPAPRTALVMGKALSAGIRGASQGVIIYILALLLQIPLKLEAAAILGVVASVVMGAALFSTFSLAVACIVKTRERFMGIGQVLTMPLFFASNAIYPIEVMPNWLKVIAHINPLTYQVDALRTLMIHGATSTFGIGFDFGVQIAALAILIVVTAKLYPNVVT